MEVRRDGFSTEQKKQKKPIGGLGDLVVGLEDGIYGDECPSLANVDRDVRLATTFEEGFAAIIKAGLAGLAYSLLMPYLDRLQDTFLTPRLEAATESGKCSPCKTQEEIEVTYRRLFKDPNPGYRRQLDDLGSERDNYVRFTKEPSAVARNIFSDLFPCDQPLRRLTDKEYRAMSQSDYQDLTFEEWTYAELAIARQMASRGRDIISRFEKAGISADGSIRLTNSNSANFPDHHYDDFLDAHNIQVLVPLTDTIGTILRSCQTEDECDGKAADLGNAPRLEQGDAQFFYGRLVLHESPFRAEGDVWMLVTLENKEKLSIREVIDRLSYIRNWKSKTPDTEPRNDMAENETYDELF